MHPKQIKSKNLFIMKILSYISPALHNPPFWGADKIHLPSSRFDKIVQTMHRFIPTLLVLSGVLPVLGGSSVLTRADDLARALQDANAVESRFDVTATVSYVCTNRVNPNMNVAGRDSSGDVLFRIEDIRTLSEVPRPGDHCRFCGAVRTNEHGRHFAVADVLSTFGHGVPPQADVPLETKTLNNYPNYRLLRISGILTDVSYYVASAFWIMLDIRRGQEHVFATLPTSDDADLITIGKHIGSSVSVTGLFVPYDHSLRLQLRRIFKIASFEDLSFPTLQSSTPSNLQRILGRVRATWQDNHAVILTEQGTFVGLEFAPDVPLPENGDLIEATGFPETDMFNLNIFNTTWRRIPAEPEPPQMPTPLSAEGPAFRDQYGKRCAYSQLHGQIVQLEGIVLNAPDKRSSDRLQIKCGPRIVAIDASTHPRALERIEEGCRIRCTGICVLEVAPPTGHITIPRLNGFFIVVRSATDIDILERPSWWTVPRMLCLVGALVVVLLLILVWNRTLRHLAEKRGRELADETIARASADLKVLERTRLAIELHDTLAQNLTGVCLEIETANRLADENPSQMRVHLDVAHKALKSCRAELRNCLWDLRHQALETDDMEIALRQALTPHVADCDMAIRFKVPRDRLTDSTAYAILRIVRELAVNAVRHGKATSLRIAGSIEGDKLLFSVKDNGCGFDPENCPGDEQGHYGLLGIRERINTFEGQMKIDSAPGRGTKVTIFLNVPQERKDVST